MLDGCNIEWVSPSVTSTGARAERQRSHPPLHYVMYWPSQIFCYLFTHFKNDSQVLARDNREN